MVHLRQARFVLALIILLFIYAAAIMLTDKQRNTTSSTRSSIENLDQAALKSLLNELGDSASNWRKLKIWAFIVAGVIGLLSVRFEMLQDDATDKREAAQSRLSLLESQASDLAISDARKQAAEANLLAKKYEADIAASNERAANAEKGTAEARLELAKLKLPRRLSHEQENRIISKFKRFTGQRFSLAVSGEAESLDLMRVLQDVLVRSGWILTRPDSFGDFRIGDANMAFGKGVIIQFSPLASNETQELARSLAQSLNDEGIRSGAWPEARIQEISDLNVLVGTKPLQ
jgi:hypothetical protein